MIFRCNVQYDGLRGAWLLQFVSTGFAIVVVDGETHPLLIAPEQVEIDVKQFELAARQARSQ
jgi:hypothetical protein